VSCICAVAVYIQSLPLRVDDDGRFYGTSGNRTAVPSTKSKSTVPPYFNRIKSANVFYAYSCSYTHTSTVTQHMLLAARRIEKNSCDCDTDAAEFSPPKKIILRSRTRSNKEKPLNLNSKVTVTIQVTVNHLSAVAAADSDRCQL
jgi:hypothetical protein